MEPGTSKKTKGRQKVEIKKMQNKSNLQVTFSKRRAGIFKKANEISVMCGGKPAIIIFSPSGKLHSYGHPSVDNIIHRYLHAHPSSSGTVGCVMEAPQGNATMEELNEQLCQLEIMLKLEREKGRMLDQLKRSKEGKRWWETPIGELNSEQLERLRRAMENLRTDVEIHKNVIQVAEGGTYFEAGPSGLSHDSSMAYSGGLFTYKTCPSGTGHDASMPYSGVSFFVPNHVVFGQEASIRDKAGISGKGNDASLAYCGVSFRVPAPVRLGPEASVTVKPGLSKQVQDAFINDSTPVLEAGPNGFGNGESENSYAANGSSANPMAQVHVASSS